MVSSDLRVRLECRAGDNKSVRRRFIMATSKPVGRGNGWSALELAAIEELSGTLALAIKGNAAPAAARDLLAAYLGGDAADRVSAGQVQRGAVSRIAAAILFADVCGFTNFAEERAPE